MRTAPRRRGQAGQALVLIAALALVLVALAGLVLDGGEITTQYRLSQSAADAAALAAAYQITTGHAESVATTQASLAVTQHGIASSNLAMTYLDSTGVATTQSGNVATVTAKVTYTFPTLFLSVMGINTATIGATGSVALRGVSCVICIMDPTANNALSISGNGTSLTLSGGVLEDNSNSPSSISVGSNGNFLNGGQGVYVIGGVSAPAGTVSPAPTTVSTVTDPLASLPVPSVTGTQTCLTSPCSPGIYSSLAFNSGTWTLSPGIYVIAGGTFSITSNATVSGSGVTVYLTCSAYPSPCNSGGQAGSAMTVSGNFTLSAPTSGTYTGVAIFSDRNNTGGVSVGGQGSLSITGTIYAKSSGISFSGGASGATFQARVIGRTLSLSGGSAFNLSYTTSGNIVLPNKLALSA